MFRFHFPQPARWPVGRRGLLHALLLALLAATFFTGARPAYAASITVDGTTCTLVNAITAANTDTSTNGCTAGSGADTITLLTDVTLTAVNNSDGYGRNGLPRIVSNITIEGGGHTISRDTGASAFRIFFVDASGTLTLNYLTLHNGNTSGTNNDAGGGINNNGGTLIVNNSTVSGNNADIGGGIYHFGTLTVSNSTLSGNTATVGGAIYSQGTMTVNNSTFSGNTASVRGGAIYNGMDHTVTLARSLLSGNTSPNGAELFNDPGSLAGGIPSGRVNAANYNLFGHDGNAGTSNFTPGATDIVPSQALAQILNSTLQVNGSGPATHALVTGSPAIDAAPHGSLATDERGVTRPQGAADDIGAFELQATPTAPNLKVDGASVSLVNGNKINVPVKFAGNGSSISSVGFVLNYDTTCLSFATTDSDKDGISDAITGLPAAFIPSISYTTNQKLEVALYDNTQPINTFTDGTLFTVQFTVNAACLPTAASPQKTMTVGFEANPAPSFGDPTGVDVAGTTSNGTITLTYTNGAPTGLDLVGSFVVDQSPVGTTVGTLNTLDPDTGDSFTYSFSSSTSCPGTDNSSFTLTGATLKTGVAVNYSTKSSYTICLRSTDGGGLYVERSFTILVVGTPVANDDLVDPRTRVLLSGETEEISVLSNDLVNNGSMFIVASLTQPATGQGSATNNYASVIYSAPATGNGTARFTYQANNGFFPSNSANVDVSYVANDLRGDCNANGSVTAADFIATVLEIFDSGDDKDANGKLAWWLIYTGSYAGSPRGCDSNGLRNGTDLDNPTDSVTAADITCTVLIFFGHACGTGVQAASADQVASLSVAAVATGGQSSIPVTLATRGQAVAAAAFALELGNATFDASDADGNGIPDAVTLNLPAGVMKSVVWNAQAQRLEVALYGVSLPLPTLADGVLATVTVDGVATPTLTQVSLSDTDGNDLLASARTSLFLPLISQ